MTTDWTVTLDVGPLSITRVNGQAPELPEILDGARVGWRFPDADVWPVQPDPTTVQLSLLVASAVDLVGIDEGTPVHFTAGTFSPPQIDFGGRVSDLKALPVRFADPVTGEAVDGLRVDLIAVDYVADLGETEVSGILDDPTINGPVWMHERVAALCELAGIPPMDWSGLSLPGSLPGTGGQGGLLLSPNDGTIEGASLLEAVDKLLARYADGGTIIDGTRSWDPWQHSRWITDGWRRGIIRALLDGNGNLDPVTPYGIEWTSRRMTGTYLSDPGIYDFAEITPGVYGMVPTPQPSQYNTVVDAGYLDYGASWTRTKRTEINRVIVSNDLEPTDFTWASTGARNQWKQIRRRRQLVAGATGITARVPEAILANHFDAQHVGDMYLDDGSRSRPLWEAQAFTWYASRDPAFDQTLTSMFPGSTFWRGHSAPIIITGIPASQQPASGGTVYVGVLKSATWVFDRSEFNIEFELTARSPRHTTYGYDYPIWDDTAAPTWASDEIDGLAQQFPTVTWNDLEPTQTWDDYQLARPLFQTAP